MVISADASFNNNPLITTYTLDIHFTYKKIFSRKLHLRVNDVLEKCIFTM